MLETKRAHLLFQVGIPLSGRNLDDNVHIVGGTGRGKRRVVEEQIDDTTTSKRIVDAGFVEPVGYCVHRDDRISHGSEAVRRSSSPRPHAHGHDRAATSPRRREGY